MEFRFDVKFGLVEYNIEWGLVFFGKGSYGLGFKGGFDGGLGGFGFGGKGGFGGFGGGGWIIVFFFREGWILFDIVFYWFEFYIKFRFYVW